MSSTGRTAWAVAFAALASGAVSAQTIGAASSGALPNPAAADISYRSTFDGFQPFSDEKVVSWKEANDNVGRIGGWREYAKEARQKGGASSAPPAAAPADQASSDPSTAGRDPHAGHAQH